MIHTGGIMMGVGRGMALLAVLLYALLPAGGIVKKTGPCGRDLCNCPPEASPASVTTAGARCPNCRPAPARYRLVPAPGAAGAPAAPLSGSASVFSLPELMLPAAAGWEPAVVAVPAAAPVWRQWGVSDPTRDVPTPPPRARA